MLRKKDMAKLHIFNYSRIDNQIILNCQSWKFERTFLSQMNMHHVVLISKVQIEPSFVYKEVTYIFLEQLKRHVYNFLENSYGCLDGWKPFRNHCILIEKQKLSWMEASQFCKDRNGVLASVKDENEQNFLYSQLPSGKLCFLNMGN